MNERINWRIPPTELKILMLAILAMLGLLLLGLLSNGVSAEEQHYEIEIRDNETIWMWSTEWAGARVFNGCGRGDGCSFKAICGEAASCDIDSSNITSSIKAYIEENRRLQKSWEEGELFSMIRSVNANYSTATKSDIESQFTKYQEWVEMKQMPSKTELDNAVIDKNKAVNELEIFKARWQALNESSSKILAVKEQYNQDLKDVNNFLTYALAIAMFILLYDSGVLSSLVERGQGILSR